MVIVGNGAVVLTFVIVDTAPVVVGNGKVFLLIRSPKRRFDLMIFVHARMRASPVFFQQSVSFAKAMLGRVLTATKTNPTITK